MDSPEVKNELEVITRMIWEPLLDGELRLLDRIPPERAKGPTQSASVHVLGEWCGTVSLEATPALVDIVAAKSFIKEVAAVTDEDRSSIFKELANVTGGNVKGLFGQGCVLSTPSMREGTDYSFSVPDTDEVLCLAFYSSGEYLLVRVHEGTLNIDDYLT